jgi:hypothetical protein
MRDTQKSGSSEYARIKTIGNQLFSEIASECYPCPLRKVNVSNLTSSLNSLFRIEASWCQATMVKFSITLLSTRSGPGIG